MKGQKIALIFVFLLPFFVIISIVEYLHYLLWILSDVPLIIYLINCVGFGFLGGIIALFIVGKAIEEIENPS